MIRPCLVALALALALGGIWQPHDPGAIDLALRHARPSFEHLLGTDHLGRDILARLMVGGWRTVSVVIIVGLIAIGGGSLLGTVAAQAGGVSEMVILRLAELPILLPTLIFAITAAALFGLSPLTAGLALGLAGLGPYTLLAHSLAQRTIAMPYVQAARALGVPAHREIGRHILPAIAPVLLAQAGSSAGLSIIAFAALAFLGLGADTSIPDWGSMLFEYRLFIFENPALMTWPGMAIAVTATLLNLTFDRI